MSDNAGAGIGDDPNAVAIVAFWRTAGPDKWYTKDDGFDAEIAERFAALVGRAAAGELTAWEATPQGTLALLILTDQFPRNLFRGSARAFATDPQAKGIAERAIARGFDHGFARDERRIFYLPFMHSEQLWDQERCIALCRAAADDEGVKFADQHADIIRRFGRFPHRNKVLGRITTADEQAFLDGGGFAG